MKWNRKRGHSDYSGVREVRECGTNKYAQYKYIGRSMIVSISHPEVTGGLNLSYGSSGTYNGWDRFGRIVDQHWTSDSAATKDRIQHSYDRNSNRLTRTNGLNSALNEVYTYDGLDRLIDTNRNGANLQDWSLDALGNWRGFTDGATTQTRNNNAANEITGISGGGWIAPVYDATGNMTSGPKPGDETTRLHFKYDAWNRLAEVKDDNAGVPGTTIASYEYDGRNYRVEKAVGADTFDVFYNEAWQVLEIRKNGDADPLEQNVWDLRYVDAPVVRFLDANTDGDYADAADSTLYYVQDANFNVTALVDAATGEVVERYSYDPYGKATVYDANWTVRSAGTAYANELQYAGYRYDAETGLYQVRNRYYHTALATWISRDPIQADINVYLYARNNPVIFVDPSGLVCCGGKEYDPCSQCCSNGKIQSKSKLCIRCDTSHCWIYTEDLSSGTEHTYGRWMAGYGGTNTSGVQTDVELNAGRRFTVERCTTVCGFSPTFAFGYGWYGSNCASYARDVWQLWTGEYLNATTWWSGDHPESLISSIMSANGGASSNVNSGQCCGVGGGSSGSSGSSSGSSSGCSCSCSPTSSGSSGSGSSGSSSGSSGSHW